MPPEMRNQVIHPVVVKPIKPISPLRRISPVRRFSPIRGISPLAKKEEFPKKVNYLIKSKDKKTLNLVLFGHIDCGKSTLLGHLLYKWGGSKKITLD
jgi:polynucleotide 5'-kinase involved in rRNA processing